jgi:hypothetical protein
MVYRWTVAIVLGMGLLLSLTGCGSGTANPTLDTSKGGGQLFKSGPPGKNTPRPKAGVGI